MGLLNELRKYVKDAMPGGLLNPEVNAQGILDGAALSTTAVPVLGDLLGLGADLHRYKNEPESRTLGNFALSGLGMLPFVPAMTAWHGSPHKFDKFSLDKIGTGEGAQAYGHGLYLAETEDVAKRYRDTLTNFRPDHIEASLVERGISPEMANTYAQFAAQKQGGPRAFDDFASVLNEKSPSPYIEQFRARMRQEMPKLKDELGAINGHLYKTDIPDEAVARFLDWDKPLSQQAPEVQAALGDLALKNQAHIGGVPIRQFIYDKTQQTGSLPSVVIGEIEKAGGLDAAIPALQSKFSGANVSAKSKLNELLSVLKQQEISMQTGVDSVRTGGDIVRGGYNPQEIAQMLQSKGIPGIRYLDGGSRSAGQGSSNFVVFDDQLPRILERNGVPTGQQPWKPGEWKGLLGR